jgi:uncharacterized protein
MKLQYQGQETIGLPLDDVWSFVVEPKTIAGCMPDVQSVTVHDATHMDVVVRVGVGPVRGNFKLKMELQPDRAKNQMGMKVSGGGMGSAVDVLATARFKDDGGRSTTLDWTGEAVMRGPVATVGGRVIDAQAQRVISQTFANVKSALGGGAATTA